jgi:hypothetical protein
MCHRRRSLDADSQRSAGRLCPLVGMRELIFDMVGNTFFFNTGVYKSTLLDIYLADDIRELFLFFTLPAVVTGCSGMRDQTKTWSRSRVDRGRF